MRQLLSHEFEQKVCAIRRPSLITPVLKQVIRRTVLRKTRMGDEAEMKLVAAWYDDQFGSEDQKCKTYQLERLLPRIE